MKQMNFPKWRQVAIPAAVICLGIFFLARYFIADELIDANDRIGVLEKNLETALKKLDEEAARATIAEREVDVVRQANALLRASERDRQDEIASLQADLAFYRRLGGANGSQAPLAVHHLELQRTPSPRVFRIIFTLTQNLRWAAVISGRIHLGVDGIQDGAARQLDENQLLADSTDPLNFKFKYFQQLERLITLPEGFEPNRLSVELKSGSLRTSVAQSMQWQSLFNDSATDSPADGDENTVD